jgi:hypothetical protein
MTYFIIYQIENLVKLKKNLPSWSIWLVGSSQRGQATTLIGVKSTFWVAQRHYIHVKNNLAPYCI